MSGLKVVYVETGRLKPYENNSRTHSSEQVDQIAASISEFGFTNPILIDADNSIIAGHGRLMAAQKIGIEKVPCIVIDGLSDAQKKALVIADNKLQEKSGWDVDILRREIGELAMEFDFTELGFDVDEIDDLIGRETRGEIEEDEKLVERVEKLRKNTVHVMLSVPVSAAPKVKEAVDKAIMIDGVRAYFCGNFVDEKD